MNRFLLLFLLLSLKTFAHDTLRVESPDKRIVFRLYNHEYRLQFDVRDAGRWVIEPSQIKLTIGGNEATNELLFGKVSRSEINETYPAYGAHLTAVNRCNQAKIELRNTEYEISIIVRVFNDGVAFQQVLSSGKPTITAGETTTFRIPSKSVAWYHDMDMHYESVHKRKQIDSVREGEWMAPPATIRLPSGKYISITEAGLTGYSGMSLQADGKNGLTIRLGETQPTSYPYRLRYSAEDTLRLKNPPLFNAPVTTPWRVIVIAKDLDQLVNTDLITNLNAAPDKKLFPQGIKTPWIKPGRAVWKYLNGGGDGTPEVMKHFADGAAALGFEHNILEGFWTRWTSEQLKDVIDYSKRKGVGTWLWKHSKSLRDPLSRDSFFRKCADLGVNGIKIDFFDHEAKEVIDLYEAILKEAAAYHLLLDFHGANKPTGLNRTYPNELTREAVKGMEASKITDRATHETTIPFTRMIAGPAEYTVMHFGERRKNTSWVHQIASAAIISAPLLTYAAHPDTILMNPAVEIIRSIPAVWDETRVLKGSEIGECAIFARRKGNVWFLAIMNGNQPKQLTIPLQFLTGNYKALIAKDGVASDEIRMEKGNFNQASVIRIQLVPGGGYIARFTNKER